MQLPYYMYKKSNESGGPKFKTDHFPKDNIQEEEQGLSPLFLHHIKPVNDLKVNEGIEMDGSASMPQSFLVYVT